jgi:hypothetical protein
MFMVSKLHVGGVMRVILLSLLVCCPLIAGSQGPAPSPSKLGEKQQGKAAGGKQKAAPPQQGTEQSPFVVRAIKTQEETKRESEQQDEQATTNRRLMYITAMLAAIAVLQLVLTALQFKASKTAQRAFVYLKGINSGIHHINGRIADYVVWSPIENFGQTPANGLQVWSRFEVVPANAGVPIFPREPNERTTALGPRVRFQTTYMAIPLASLSAVWRDESAIFVWVRVEYRDIFNPKVVRHHQICSRVRLLYDPSEERGPDHPLPLQFVPEGPQNTAG